MAKTKDRWDKKAESLRLEYIASPFVTQIPMVAWPALEYEISKLLRQQHRATVRMVKKELLSPIGKSERCEGWNQAIEAILDCLKRMTK